MSKKLSFSFVIPTLNRIADWMGLKPNDGKVLCELFHQNPILKVGDKFCTNFSPKLTFKVLSISHRDNKITVLCSNLDGVTWTEDWDDLDTVYSALKIGEYKIIKQNG